MWNQYGKSFRDVFLKLHWCAAGIDIDLCGYFFVRPQKEVSPFCCCLATPWGIGTCRLAYNNLACTLKHVKEIAVVSLSCTSTKNPCRFSPCWFVNTGSGCFVMHSILLSWIQSATNNCLQNDLWGQCVWLQSDEDHGSRKCQEKPQQNHPEEWQNKTPRGVNFK